ncbi:MAG: 4-(cytidine 5'-diphospho)-2-C-methyl-D-erythritol kinase [Chloroflexota bacterium]
MTKYRDGMVTIFAHAKVNLSLEVLGRRDDGYHEIVSVLQNLDLADVLTVEPASDLGFMCPEVSRVRSDLLEEAVMEAANIVRDQTGYTGGALIRLGEINVPRATGLGASSSLPAAVLKGLNEVWSLKLSFEELTRLASEIGSDTPFFLYGGTALAEGRGEKVTPLPSPPPTWLVLLNPRLDIGPSKTATLYRALNPSHFTSGALTQELVNTLRQGNRLQPSMLYNTFENVAFDVFPQLEEYRRMFLDAGAGEVHLAGAGPALVSLVPDKQYGETLVESLRGWGLEAYLTHTV